MFANGLNMALPQWTWVEKTLHGVESHWLSGKEKVLGIAASKEGHGDSVLGHKRINHYKFPWKRWNCKQGFLLPIPWVKFILFIEWPLYISYYNGDHACLKPKQHHHQGYNSQGYLYHIFQDFIFI